MHSFTSTSPDREAPHEPPEKPNLGEARPHPAGGATADDAETLRFGPFSLSLARRVLLRDGVEAPLGDRAFDTLALLATRAGEVVTKREILDHVWPGLFVDEANLRAQIAQLRSVLGDAPDTPARILNVRGRGYVFTTETAGARRPARPTAQSGEARLVRLPRRGQRLLGRARALDEILALSSTRPLTTIVGPGGFGKTVLAIEAGHRQAESSSADVCFIDLGALHAGDLVLPTVASALGCAWQGEDLLDALVKNLADRDLLLILDCCEHVLGEVCELATALLRNTSVRVLATSREALRAEDERVYLLPPLELPAEKAGLSAEEAITAAAVQLFMERAASRGYIGELHDQDAATLAEICRHLDGVPLAIEMVASRLPTYGFSGLLAALSGRAMLDWPGRRNDARHQSLQSALDWSFQLLSPEEQRVLARLSILSGPFSVADAQSVACLEGEEPWMIVSAIEGLADKSLLAMTTYEGQQTFRMLDVTRLYASLKLAESAEARAVAESHARWCAARLSEVYPLESYQPPPERRTAERAVGNVRAALEWAFSADGDTRFGFELAAYASRMFRDLSMHTECLRWCAAALDLTGRDAAPTLPALRLQESLAQSLMFTAGNQQRLEDAIDRGLEMARALGARETHLHLLAGSNLYHTRRGDYRSALVAAEQFAALADDDRRPSERVAADWLLGATHLLIGDPLCGEQFLEHGHALAETMRERPPPYFGYDHAWRGTIARGLIAWLRGKPETAVALTKHGLAAVCAENHPISMCIAHLYASWLTLWLRDLEWGEEVAEVVYRIAERHQLKPYLAGSIALRGQLLLLKGDVGAALEVLAGVTGSLREDRLHIVLDPALRAYAEALCRVGQAPLAEEIVSSLVRSADDGMPTYLLPELLRTWGDIRLAGDAPRIEAAEGCYLRALDVARTSGALGWELRAATSVARLWIGAGRADEARSLLRGTLALFTEGGDTPDLAEARALLPD